MRHAVWLALALALGAGCAAGLRREPLARGDLAGLERHMADVATRQMREHQVEALSIAIVGETGTLLEAGYGFADPARRKRADAHTRYAAGSVTKLLTATALVRLAEEGRVDLDRPLVAYVPGFRMRQRVPGAQQPTLRAVLAHHSGLPTDRLAGMFGRDPGRYQDLPALLIQDYLAAPPWTILSYSNLGYSLLGSAIETASGVLYPQYVTRTLLSPLGMIRSNFDPERPEPARPYLDGKPTWEPRLRDTPAGGLYTSAHDLGRFLRMVLGGGQLEGKRVLREDTLQEMLRPQNTGVPLDFDQRIGLGWFRLPAPDGATLLAHTGKTINYHAVAGFDPVAGIGVALLASSRTAAEMVEPLAREALALAREVGTGLPSPPDPFADDPIPTSGSVPTRNRSGSGPGAFRPSDTAAGAADLSSHAGVYATLGGLVAAERRPGSLRLRAAGLEGEALPMADGSFRLRLLLWGLLPWEPAELEKVRVEVAEVGERHVVVARARGIRVYAGERIVPRPIPAAWRAREGRYLVSEPGDDWPLFREFHLAEEAGFLVWRLVPLAGGQAATLPLLAVDDGEAILAGSGRNLGETLRAERGPAGEELVYSGYRLTRQSPME